MTMPSPTPVHWDEEFWTRLANGVLSVQTCRVCGNAQHYPRPACTSCLSRELDWSDLAGTGVVYSFTTVRVPLHPAFRDQAPLMIVDVDVDEGHRVVGRLVDGPDADSPDADSPDADSTDADIAIGSRVQVVVAPAELPAGIYFSLLDEG